MPSSSFSLTTHSTLSTTCLMENASFSIESNNVKWEFIFSCSIVSFLSLVSIARFISQVDSCSKHLHQNTLKMNPLDNGIRRTENTLIIANLPLTCLAYHKTKIELLPKHLGSHKYHQHPKVVLTKIHASESS